MNLIHKSEKIFIAGSTGMVGSAIKRKLNILGYKNLISPNSFELDLKDENLVFECLRKKNLI